MVPITVLTHLCLLPSHQQCVGAGCLRSCSSLPPSLTQHTSQSSYTTVRLQNPFPSTLTSLYRYGQTSSAWWSLLAICVMYILDYLHLPLYTVNDIVWHGKVFILHLWSIFKGSEKQNTCSTLLISSFCELYHIMHCIFHVVCTILFTF